MPSWLKATQTWAAFFNRPGRLESRWNARACSGAQPDFIDALKSGQSRSRTRRPSMRLVRSSTMLGRSCPPMPCPQQSRPALLDLGRPSGKLANLRSRPARRPSGPDALYIARHRYFATLGVPPSARHPEYALTINPDNSDSLLHRGIVLQDFKRTVRALQASSGRASGPDTVTHSGGRADTALAIATGPAPQHSRAIAVHSAQRKSSSPAFHRAGNCGDPPRIACAPGVTIDTGAGRPRPLLRTE